MYISTFTDDYDNYTDHINITHKKFTIILNDSDSFTLSNCTNNVDIIITTLLFTKTCGLSILGLLSVMIYTLTKPLFRSIIKVC